MATPKVFRQVEVPQQKLQDDGLLFPAVLSPDYDQQADDLHFFKEAIRAEKPWLESLLEKNGAILFRGFPVDSASDFNSVIEEAFGFPEAPYVGGRAPRTHVVGRVYTANESPPQVNIPFHHELSFVLDPPLKLFFFCEEEPGKGGETPLIWSNIIYEKMKERYPKLVAQLEEHGLTYTRVLGDEVNQSSIGGSNWQTAYMTDDKKIAEERAAKLGTKMEWVGNSVKLMIGPIAAIRLDKKNQRKTWFNHLIVIYNGILNGIVPGENSSVTLGNGETIPQDAMKDCLKIVEENCVAIPWKKGDVLLVNNMMVLHARRPLLKPPRRILISLCN